MINKNAPIYTVAFTFLYTFLFIALITVVFMFSKDKIELNKTLFVKKAVLDAMGITYSSDSEADANYDKSVTVKEVDVDTLYSASVNNEKVYLVNYSGSALWGTVYGVLAVNGDVSRIVGMRITEHSETPGLGGRIAEDWYMKQFTNEKIPDGKLVFDRSSGKGNYDSEDGTVDVVTGATRTSESLDAMINETLSKLKELKKKNML